MKEKESVQFSKVANLHSRKKSECEYSSRQFHHSRKGTKGNYRDNALGKSKWSSPPLDRPTISSRPASKEQM
jgi:hypothetical protein